jgi:iron complex transport system substrate-binding protein
MVLAAFAIVPALVVASCANGSSSAGGAPAGSAGSTSPKPSSPSPSPSPSFPVTLTDDDGQQVTIAEQPRRIVTFAPANTEIVYALGLGAELVGVSGSFDDYPPEAASLPKVSGAGGVAPDVEKVVSLHPDVLLATAGGEDWKGRLRKLGITVFSVNATSFADLLHDILAIGTVTGAEARATSLTDGMLQTADQIHAKVTADPAVSCFYEVYDPPLYTVGPGSFIYDLLVQAGCTPVTSSATSAYPQWSVEKLVAEQPQVYLLDSDSSAHTVEQLAKRAGFSALSAVTGGRVAVIDSDLVSRPGPRVVQGIEELAKALHPDAFATG